MRQGEKLSVMVLSGGRGAEHDVSLMSAKYVESLIDREKFLPIPVYIAKTGEWLSSGEHVTLAYRGRGGILVGGEFIGIDVALPVLHGDFGEDGVVQGALENVKISYVGCDVFAGSLCSDKAFTKSVARELGIDVAEHTVSKKGECSDDFIARVTGKKFPIFIKPARLGSSIGARITKNESELRLAVENAYKLSDKIIAEEFIDVEYELECAYLSACGVEIFSDVGLISSKCGFYDFEKKYNTGDGVVVTANADISRELSDKIRKYSKLLADTIGIRHLARFDFLLSKDGRLTFNEINTLPGFTETSLYPRLIERSGIPPKSLIEMLIYDAVG